jgi:uncharacterized protein YjlB
MKASIAMQTRFLELNDDGRVPNNPTLPLFVYEGAFAPGTDTADVIARFAANGWQGAWVNGIYDFHHYHARAHEVLANLGDAVTVQFGGADGPTVAFGSGDVVVIPAGGGHCRLSGGGGLVIVGAYPAGQEDWDLKRADNAGDYQRALTEIANVALPQEDPVTSGKGPLLACWGG